MASPWHQHASVPVHGTPSIIHERLTTDPAAVVATATAAALARLEPLVRSWGLTPATLPAVTTQATDADAVGAVQLRWSGDEDATVWPSLTARILVVPDAPDQARLVLLTPRSPRAELATRRLERVHRERVVDVAVQRFLLELADRLADPDAFLPVGSPLTRFDRRPIFVHHGRTLDTDPQALVSELLGDPVGLARDTTTGRCTHRREPWPRASSATRRPPPCGSHPLHPGPSAWSTWPGPPTRKPPAGPTSSSPWPSKPPQTAAGW